MSTLPFPLSRRGRAACAALILAATTLLPARARAQSSDEDRASARKLSFDAAAALEAKDYAGAADKFARADALFHAPTLTLGLARAQVGLGKLVAAQETYQRIVREGVPAGGNKQFEDAVKDATRELAALEPRVPWVTLQVTGTTEAAVTLDGTALNSAALGVKRAIDPGKHTLRATATGFKPAERPFTMAEGQTETVTLTMEPEGAAAAPFASVPEGAIGVPPEGDTATSSGGSSPMKMIGFIALGVGGAGLILGGITGGLAVREHGILSDNCDGNDCPSDRRETLDSFHTLSTVSTVGFVAGGILAAGGVTLIILAPSSKKQSGATVVPYAGLGQVGAVGRF